MRQCYRASGERTSAPQAPLCRMRGRTRISTRKEDRCIGAIAVGKPGALDHAIDIGDRDVVVRYQAEANGGFGQE